MNPGWKVFWLFAAIFAAALGAERHFVPDIVPIAFADVPQSFWALQAAFVLRTIELITGIAAAYAFGVMTTAWAARHGYVSANLEA